jgi:hypothetical protein
MKRRGRLILMGIAALQVLVLVTVLLSNN